MVRLRFDMHVPKYMVDNVDPVILARVVRKYIMDAYGMLLDVKLGNAKKPEAALTMAMAHLFMARVALEVLQQLKTLEAQKLAEELELPDSVKKILYGEEGENS